MPSSGVSYDAELAARLWDMSASLTNGDAQEISIPTGQ